MIVKITKMVYRENCVGVRLSSGELITVGYSSRARVGRRAMDLFEAIKKQPQLDFTESVEQVLLKAIKAGLEFDLVAGP